MKFTGFLSKLFQSNSGFSSKRFSGFLGWLVCIGIVIYLSYAGKEAPDILSLFMVLSVSLLGLDTITGVFKGFQFSRSTRKNESDNITRPNESHFETGIKHDSICPRGIPESKCPLFQQDHHHDPQHGFNQGPHQGPNRGFRSTLSTSEEYPDGSCPNPPNEDSEKV